MKRNYLIDEPIPLKHKELVLQTAFHEAGHAAAIYLCNLKKQLPPVHFQITLGALCGTGSQPLPIKILSKPNWVATVEGGHLIHSLPVAVIENSCYFSDHESIGYQQACEADIINLLAGPLAEAKYVAQRDDEYINDRLINVNSLKYYGGTSDLHKVDEYLDGLIGKKNKTERLEKLNELFLAAFEFIDEPVHWQAINDLAHFILQNDQDIISCEEAIAVMDKSISSSAQYKIQYAGFQR
ncbi:MAG: hypothetical protein ACU85E_00005 [Gammaproteobacteria bacterium]